MSNAIYEARLRELSPKDAALLWRFTAAYRPHDQPPTWQALKASGLEKIEEDSLMDIIEDQYEAEKESAEAAKQPTVWH
jgi:hypothetical protein